MTNFEAFTTVKEHLLKQGKKALNNNKCMYRGDNGLKCAVGCLITDDEYYVGMEHKAVCDINQIDSLCWLDEDMLDSLQEIHDNMEVDEWESELNDMEKELFHEV